MSAAVFVRLAERRIAQERHVRADSVYACPSDVPVGAVDVEIECYPMPVEGPFRVNVGRSRAVLARPLPTPEVGERVLVWIGQRDLLTLAVATVIPAVPS